jgi:hypothetical protein
MKRDTSKCYENCDRKAFFVREFMESIEIEKVQEFYEWLQGNEQETICTLPEIFGRDIDEGKITWKPEDIPHLTQEQAFAVIYYLQEALYILPDTYEKCRKCGDLYDSDNDGCRAGYCDGCGCQVDYDSLENGCEDCPLWYENQEDGEGDEC